MMINGQFFFFLHKDNVVGADLNHLVKAIQLSTNSREVMEKGCGFSLELKTGDSI